ncbi:MAG TPA: peptidyl-tRNA hydrolase, partial [Candidatus Thalassarchaeaceae archaeon]
MVLVTRADLNLSKGKMAAQCGHAVSECVLKASSKDNKVLKRYISNGARKIV